MTSNSLIDCKYYLIHPNKCKNTQCLYRHKITLSSSHIPICKKWENYECFDLFCLFQHPYSIETSSINTNNINNNIKDKNQVVCKFYQYNNYCKNGLHCLFLHEIANPIKQRHVILNNSTIDINSDNINETNSNSRTTTNNNIDEKSENILKKYSMRSYQTTSFSRKRKQLNENNEHDGTNTVISEAIGLNLDTNIPKDKKDTNQTFLNVVNLDSSINTMNT